MLLPIVLVLFNIQLLTELLVLKNKERKEKIRTDSDLMLNFLINVSQRKKLFKLDLHLVHIKQELNGKEKIWMQERTIG